MQDDLGLLCGGPLGDMAHTLWRARALETQCGCVFSRRGVKVNEKGSSVACTVCLLEILQPLMLRPEDMDS